MSDNNLKPQNWRSLKEMLRKHLHNEKVVSVSISCYLTVEIIATRHVGCPCLSTFKHQDRFMEEKSIKEMCNFCFRTPSKPISWHWTKIPGSGWPGYLEVLWANLLICSWKKDHYCLRHHTDFENFYKGRTNGHAWSPPYDSQGTTVSE